MLNEIVCRVCESHEWKIENSKYICKGCGYAMTDDDKQEILQSAYQDCKNEYETIDLKLKDTKTGNEYTRRLTLEEYAAILYVLKVVEWR